MASSPVEPGEILAGKYRVERVLGVGGMGIVVAAVHLELDERVAVKFMLPEAAADAQVVARFLQEGRAAVKIKSEHVARIKDVGRLDGGVPYLVMEYLEGEDLAALLERGGPLSPALAVEYLVQAVEAVAEIHAAGIVHRDLKPGNLFLTRRADGSACIKVLDFGIAKITGESRSQQAMTSTTAVLGSPLYMSPEQLTSSRDVDGRTDIWSLGVILCELLTGQAPFAGDTMAQLCTSILALPPRPLDGRVPAPLAAAILRCLSKSPSERFQTVADLGAAIAGGPTMAATWSGLTLPARSRGFSGAFVAGVGAAVLLAVGGAVAFVTLSRRDAATAAAPPIAVASADPTPPATLAVALDPPASAAVSATSAPSSAPVTKSAAAPKISAHATPAKRGLGLPEGRK